ncbi:MAG: hypothetical protein ACRC1K_05030, partial [Planctomycetia bacterium]
DRLFESGTAAACAGKPYFISQDDPFDLWQLIDGILTAAHGAPVVKRVSARTAYAVGAVLETVYKLLGRRDEPPMTRFVAAQLSHPHWFDVSAAKRDLRFTPRLSIEDGLRKLAAWYDAHPEACYWNRPA